MAFSRRKALIRSLIPRRVERLLDVGSGPILPDYAYADRAESILCVDWKMVKIGEIPKHIQGISGNFIDLDIPNEAFDVVIAADVFEHIQVECETRFIDKCVSVLRPNGKLIISVPCKGRYAWLDPYEIKPLCHRILARLGLFKSFHNGTCDIRKGHKHYRLEELKQQFARLDFEQVRYWGHFFDPLLSWTYAVFGEDSKIRLVDWLERRADDESRHDFGTESFNMAAVFTKTA